MKVGPGGPWFTEESIEAIMPEVRGILEGKGYLSSHRNCEELERAFSGYIGVKHSVSVSSGTGALETILRSIGVEGREVVAESMENLQKVFRQKPDPFMHYLKITLDAKADEFVNIFSESFTEEKNRVVTILREIDPSNEPKYQKILSAN